MATAANKAQDRIKWMFTTDKARAKLRRAYPAVVKDKITVMDQ